MARTLVSLQEIITALQGCPQIKVDGEPHLDADDLRATMGPLLGAQPNGLEGMRFTGLESVVSPGTAFPASAPTGDFVDPERGTVTFDGETRPLTDTEARSVSEGRPFDFELAREGARLAALPPGPCVTCKAVHPGEPNGRCEAYVDSTERSPIQARINRNPGGLGTGGRGIETLPHVDPVIDSRPAHLGGRQPANATEFNKHGSG